jgi:galactose mutarotase-like enzyme
MSNAREPEITAARSIAPVESAVRSVGGFEAVVLSNGRIQVTFVPELGGKMTSLRRLSTGTEFLLQPPTTPLRRYSGGAFEDYDTSGFDECFPTVTGCEYPEGDFAGTELPDHGELWSSPWRYVVRGDELCMAIAARKLPCEFRKRVRLDGDTVVLQYEIQSFTDAPFFYIWSSHPLLTVRAGDRILLPLGVDQMLVNASSDSHLGDLGAICDWPLAKNQAGGTEDISVVKSRTASSAKKLYTNKVAVGCAALYHAASNESIAFHFDPQTVPYIGVWICEGGWPTTQNGHHTVAIEPCSGRPDSLAEAVARKECPELLPGAVHRWELRIQIQDGVPSSLSERLKR